MSVSPVTKERKDSGESVTGFLHGIPVCVCQCVDGTNVQRKVANSQRHRRRRAHKKD